MLAAMPFILEWTLDQANLVILPLGLSWKRLSKYPPRRMPITAPGMPMPPEMHKQVVMCNLCCACLKYSYPSMIIWQIKKLSPNCWGKTKSIRSRKVTIQHILKQFTLHYSYLYI